MNAELCRLCLKPNALRRSHIVPEFMYGHGYDEKHRLWAIERESPRLRYLQKGLRERMLCDGCERHLNDEYEKPCASFWYRELPEVVTDRDMTLSVGSDGYGWFKLFHLSILWRASVSGLTQFNAVELGPLEEKLRKRVLDGDAGDPDEFQIFAQLLVHGDPPSTTGGCFMSPIVTRIEGKRIYTMVFGSCAWHYVASRHPIGEMTPRALQEDGTLPVIVTPMSSFRAIDDGMKEHFRLKRASARARSS